MVKICSKCNDTKDIIKFNKRKSSSDGFRNQCKSCRSLYKKKWQKENPEKGKLAASKHYKSNKEEVKERSKQWRLDNSEKYKSNQKEWKTENREYVLEQQAEYRKNNKEKIRAAIKKHYEENKALYLHYSAKRRAALLNATPEWLTEKHWNDIKEIYQDAKDIQWLNEEPLHIDHIVPLRGDNVSGLHVPWNLQILTQSKNCSKQNKTA